MTIEGLQLRHKLIIFACPECGTIIYTNKLSWKRWYCKYCRSYIRRDKIRRMYSGRLYNNGKILGQCGRAIILFIVPIMSK